MAHNNNNNSNNKRSPQANSPNNNQKQKPPNERRMRREGRFRNGPGNGNGQSGQNQSSQQASRNDYMPSAYFESTRRRNQHLLSPPDDDYYNHPVNDYPKEYFGTFNDFNPREDYDSNREYTQDQLECLYSRCIDNLCSPNCDHQLTYNQNLQYSHDGDHNCSDDCEHDNSDELYGTGYDSMRRREEEDARDWYQREQQRESGARGMDKRRR
jgi:hypothetical protein